MAKSRRSAVTRDQGKRLHRAYVEAFIAAHRTVSAGLERLAGNELQTLREHYESALKGLGAVRDAGSIRAMARTQVQLLRDTIDRVLQSARISLDILSDTRKELGNVMAKSSRLKKLASKVKSRLKKARSAAKKRGAAAKRKAKSAVSKGRSKARKVANKGKASVKKAAAKGKKTVAKARKKAEAAVKPVVAKAAPIVAAVAKPMSAVTPSFMQRPAPADPKPASEAPTPPPSNPFKTF